MLHGDSILFSEFLYLRLYHLAGLTPLCTDVDYFVGHCRLKKEKKIFIFSGLEKLKCGITRWLYVWKHVTFLQTMTMPKETFENLIYPNLPAFPYGWRHWVPLGPHYRHIQTYAELEYNNLTEIQWPRIQAEIRASGDVYWSDIVTEIERRGKALADARCPPEGSEAWNRIVALTPEVCNEYNAAIKRQWEKDWEKARLLAAEHAADFAALPYEALVELCPSMYHREEKGAIWSAITCLLPTELLLRVEDARDAEDKERNEEARRFEECERRMSS